LSITIVSSFIIQANVITIVNYDRQTFIVQATGFHYFMGFWDFQSIYLKMIGRSLKNTLALGLQLMLNPCQRSSACKAVAIHVCSLLQSTLISMNSLFSLLTGPLLCAHP
jgi:hypothetical protein